MISLKEGSESSLWRTYYIIEEIQSQYSVVFFCTFLKFSELAQDWWEVQQSFFHKIQSKKVYLACGQLL